MSQDDPNERRLKSLSRTIRLSCAANDPSETVNTLILAHCNYHFLRKQLVQKLHQSCTIPIRELVLPPGVETPYTAIMQELGDETPQVLMVFGLESVLNLDQAWDAMKRSVELFLKLPFPLIFWVNDEVLHKCIRVAPDFYTRSTTTTFTTTSNLLKTFLSQETERLFENILDTNREHFSANSAFDLGIHPNIAQELEFAVESLSNSNQLDPELQASQQFILARNIYAQSHKKQPRSRARKKMIEARKLYQKSLSFWQDNHQKKRQACLLLHLGWWWRRYAKLHHHEYQNSCRHARNYYQQCLGIFEEIERPDLVAKFINFLGEVLRQLQEWDALNKLAGKAIKLHEMYPSRLRLAAAYGYLSEVALSKKAWVEAKQCAETAISIQAQLLRTLREPNIPVLETHHEHLVWTRYYYGNWYRFLLAQAQQHLNQENAAIQNLKKARAKFPISSHPSVYLRILEALRNLYFQQGKYFEAFHIKQEKRAVEHAYEFRAFVGAGRLQPEQLQMSPNLGTREQQVVVAEEIANSERHKDLERLINRIERDDYKLTIIYGPSGVGKSSILQAGLIPAVAKQKIATRTVVPVLQQIYKHWQKELYFALKKSLQTYSNLNLNLNFTNYSSESFLEFFKTNIQNKILTVIVFDQFEEFFFIHEDRKERQEFYQFVSQCLEIPYTKIIFSLREDYLHHLLELNRLNSIDIINNNILDKNILYYLGNFSLEDAHSIIQTATEETNPLEPALIDVLVEDLSSESHEVLLIEMQIVGAQLQTQGISTLEAYRNLGEQPKEKLVENYLEEVIQDCGLENEEMSQLVLYLLTHENQTRPFKTKSQLEEDLKAGFKSQGSINIKLNLILNIFVNSGLVLRFQNHPENFYQLAHDYLVYFIRQRQDEKLVKKLENAIRQKKIKEAENKKLNEVNRELNTAINELTKEKEQSRILREDAIYQRSLKEEELKRVEIINQQFNTTILELEDERNKVKSTQLELQNAERTRKQIIRRGLIGSGASLGIGLIFIIGSLLFSNNEFKKVKIANLEQEGITTFFEFKNGAKNLKTLISAMELGNELNQFIQPDTPLQNYPTTSPLLALQTTLNNLYEKNQFTSHQGWVTAANFRDDGQQIATAGTDKTVRILDLAGQELFQLQGYSSNVNDLDFGLNGQVLVTAGEDSNVVIWNSFEQKQNIIDVQKIPLCNQQKNQALQSCKFNSDQAKLWRVKFTPDGNLFATVGKDNIAKIWNLFGQEVISLNRNQEEIHDVAFSPDGQLIATAGSDGTAIISNLLGERLQILKGHNEDIFSLEFSSDGQSLITAGEDKFVKIWNVVSGKQIEEFEAHERPITSMSLSLDGQRIATASVDQTIKLWNFSGQLLAQIGGHQESIYDVNFSRDGQYLVTAGRDSITRLWSLSRLNEEQWQTNQKSIWGLDWNQQQNQLVTAGQDGVIKLWDLSRTLLAEFQGHQGTIYGVSFSPNGELLATVGEEGKAKLWDLSGQLLTEFQGHQGTIYGVSFSPDGELIVTTGEDETVRLWNLSGEQVQELTGHQGTVYGVSFSPDGELLATTGEDKTVRLWDLSGKQVQELKGHQDKVYGVSFSPDGQYIATAGRDDTIKVWTTSGELKQSWKADSRRVENLSFSPNGQYIVTVGSTGQAKVWNLSGQLIAEFEVYIKGALNLTFISKDQFATVGNDGIIKLWTVSNLENLLERGCNWLQYYFVTRPEDKNNLCP